MRLASGCFLLLALLNSGLFAAPVPRIPKNLEQDIAILTGKKSGVTIGGSEGWCGHFVETKVDKKIMQLAPRLIFAQTKQIKFSSARVKPFLEKSAQTPKLAGVVAIGYLEKGNGATFGFLPFRLEMRGKHRCLVLCNHDGSEVAFRYVLQKDQLHLTGGKPIDRWGIAFEHAGQYKQLGDSNAPGKQ